MKSLLLLLLFLNQSIWSADLSLFNIDGTFNDEFAKNILNGDLKAGENIHLDGRSVTYKKTLGSGNTTIILEVYDSQKNKSFALRLPHGNTDKRFSISDGKRYINHTYNGYNELKQAKLPIPQIHEYKKNSYLLVDLIDHDFNLRTFLARNALHSESDKKKVLESLLEFSKKTSLFDSIADFHLEQAVYSKKQNKWFLLDWASGHQLARMPSSPTIFSHYLFSDNNKEINEEGEELLKKLEDGQKVNVKREISDFEKDVYELLKNEIETQRRKQTEIDNIELDKIKSILSTINSHEEILNTYKNIDSNHMGSFFTMLQKDFIDNQLEKFPKNALRKEELKALLDRMGKYSPYYFSQFAEKVIENIYDIETFKYLYNRINRIGVDEEIEDDIAQAIAKNIQRILQNSYSNSTNIKAIEELRSDFGLINYRTRDILKNANEYLQPARNCRELISNLL